MLVFLVEQEPHVHIVARFIFAEMFAPLCARFGDHKWVPRPGPAIVFESGCVLVHQLHGQMQTTHRVSGGAAFHVRRPLLDVDVTKRLVMRIFRFRTRWGGVRTVQNTPRRRGHDEDMTAIVLWCKLWALRQLADM